MNSQQVYFPFTKPRDEQEKLVRDVMECIVQKKHLIAQAPTGLGKTVATMAPAISYALEHHKSVFFLTPKISQHAIALEVVQSMVEKFQLPLRATDLVGKKYMCSDPILSTIEFDGFYELCAKRIKNENCPYYANALGFDKKQKNVSSLYQDQLFQQVGFAPSHHEVKQKSVAFKSAGKEKPLCAYYSTLELAKKSNVIIADYYHIMQSSVQETILNKLNIELKDCILILDEAHNLPERVRKTLSASLNTFVLEKASEELEKLGKEELRDQLQLVEKTLKELGKNGLGDRKKEILVSKEQFLNPLQDTIEDLESFVLELKHAGSDYLESSGKTRSQLIGVSNFFEKWLTTAQANARVLKRLKSGETALTIKALDPGASTSKTFDECHSAILMSGTMLPTKMYQEIMGLDPKRTVLKEYVSPFPKNNRLALVVPTVTTKYSKRNMEEYEKIANEVAKICNKVPGNCAVFFPSYDFLENVHAFLHEKLSRTILRQSANMNSGETTQLLQKFKNASHGFGGILLAVTNGSLAEGIDLPGNQLLGVVVVGIPLQEPDLELQCLIDYYEEKYHAGWHYAYTYPAISKAIQAAGRLIRNESDRGIVAFLDSRYTWENYRKCFPKEFERITTEEPEKYVEAFWKND